jgi:hypothetical protein
MSNQTSGPPLEMSSNMKKTRNEKLRQNEPVNTATQHVQDEQDGCLLIKYLKTASILTAIPALANHFEPLI